MLVGEKGGVSLSANYDNAIMRLIDMEIEKMKEEDKANPSLDGAVFEAVHELVRRSCMNLNGGDCFYFAGWNHPECNNKGECRHKKWVELLRDLTEKKEDEK